MSIARIHNDRIYNDLVSGLGDGQIHLVHLDIETRTNCGLVVKMGADATADPPELPVCVPCASSWQLAGEVASGYEVPTLGQKLGRQPNPQAATAIRLRIQGYALLAVASGLDPLPSDFSDTDEADLARWVGHAARSILRSVQDQAAAQ